MAAQAVQPPLPGCGVDDPVGVTELVRCAVAAVGHRRPASEGHRDLRAEARGQTQRVVDRVGATGRQVEHAEVGIGLLVVGHRRHDAGLQGLDRHDILDAGAHGVTGEALGVGDDDLAGVGTEAAPQRVDLGRGTATPGGGVGLVRDEHHLVGDLVAPDAALFDLGDEGLHDAADVADIQA